MSEKYKQEIIELTKLMRSNEDWDDLRTILIDKGFNLNEIALVVFMEDDEENEFGVIVNKNEKVYDYLRSNNVGTDTTKNFHLSDISEDEYEKIKYPQINEAKEMFKNNEI